MIALKMFFYNCMTFHVQTLDFPIQTQQGRHSHAKKCEKGDIKGVHTHSDKPMNALLEANCERALMLPRRPKLMPEGPGS